LNVRRKPPLQYYAARSIAYELPDQLVAIHPAEPRDSSRLLSILPRDPANLRPTRRVLFNHSKTIYNGFETCPTKFGDFHFKDLTRLLPPSGCHIVMNSSKVLSARLLAMVDQQACEVLLLSPSDDSADPNGLLAQPATGQTWRCMIRNDTIQVDDQLSVIMSSSIDGDGDDDDDQNQDQDTLIRNGTTTLRVAAVHEPWLEEGENDGVEADVTFESNSNTMDMSTSMDDLLRVFGAVPIPPYLNRDAIQHDDITYQTVYANKQGSVAAPTAGLHFSDSMMDELQNSNHIMSDVTLHVGAGTFKPVVDGIDEHQMHRESFEVTKNALNSLIASLSNNVPIVPVGTTSVRVLESLYWMGARTMLQSEKWYQGAPTTLMLGQWEPHAITQEYLAAKQHLPLAHQAFESLLWEIYPAADGEFCIRGNTEICIAHDYQFQVIDGLVTNFHQSKSTLMYLASAVLGGEARLREAYTHAIAERYRFLSYGDACFMVVADTCKRE
jgi:S-adenosylmethionine:tRNA-ribosyltransferase-isomerase (queuine synthetase)